MVQISKMTSRSTLSLLLVATLLGLSWAGSMDDQFYRKKTGVPALAYGLPAATSSEQQQSRPGRDSWKKLSMDMLKYLTIFGSSSGALEKHLKELSEKVERELEKGSRESYNMIYAKNLLNEQRAVIEALRAAVPNPETATVAVDTTLKVPSYDEIIQKTEQFVRPLKKNSAPSKDQVAQELSTEHDKLIQALQSLQNLKI